MSAMYETFPWPSEVNAVLIFATLIVGLVVLIACLWKCRTFRVHAIDVAPRTTAEVEPEPEILDTKKLSSELVTVTEWFNLGLNLGLKMHELKKIEEDHEGNDRRRLETLHLWLQHTPNASWEDVVNALQEMGEKKVAEEIHRKYIRRERRTAGGTVTESPMYTQEGVNGIKDDCDSLSGKVEEKGDPGIQRSKRSHEPQADQEPSKTAVFLRENQQAIKGKFAAFQKNVCDKLFKNGVNTKEFRLFVINQFSPGDCIPPSPDSLLEVFEAITHHGLWDYFHYSPLVQIVNTFGADDPEMASWVQTYKQDLKAYRLVTTIENYIEADPASPEWAKHDLDVAEPTQVELAKCDPRYYCPVEWKTKFTEHSLQYLTEVWELFSSHYLMPDSPPTALLNCVRRGCISVTWLIPSGLIPPLIKRVKIYTKFFRQHRIIKVMVSKECVYEEVTEENTLETGAVATSASVVQVDPSVKEREDELYQEKMETTKNPPNLPQSPDVSTQKRTTQKEVAGYECDFVDPPPPAFQTECLICKQVLREPYLVKCCGTSFCQKCIQQVQTLKGSCPNCRMEDFIVFPNKGLKRSLNQLYVYCTHSKDGCTWSGELQALDEHLNKETQLVGCQFAEIQCEFSYAGCKFQAARKDMATHIFEQLPYHTQLLARELGLIEKLTKSLQQKDKTIYSLQQRLVSVQKEHNLGKDKLTQHNNMPSQPIPVNQCFTMDKFQEHKENDSQWYSEPFYTHDLGYKMCLRVDANGYDKASGTHLSLFTCFMKGEFDSQLSWPFYGQIVVELLNQNADNHHHEYIIYYDHSTTEYARRMRIGTRSRGWGNSRFVSHAKLLKNSGSKIQYLKDDCLKFRVREVQLHDRDSENRPSSAMQCIVA